MVASGVNLIDEHFVLGEVSGLVVLVDPGEGVSVDTPAIQAATADLLLLVMFRSIIIPIKTIILNLLSVGAAYGVLVIRLS